MTLARLILVYATIAAAIGTAGRYAFAAMRWAYGWLRNIDVMAQFVRTMHTNHLPHIYKRLGRIDDRLGLPREDPPVADTLPNPRSAARDT